MVPTDNVGKKTEPTLHLGNLANIVYLNKLSFLHQISHVQLVNACIHVSYKHLFIMTITLCLYLDIIAPEGYRFTEFIRLFSESLLCYACIIRNISTLYCYIPYHAYTNKICLNQWEMFSPCNWRSKALTAVYIDYISPKCVKQFYYNFYTYFKISFHPVLLIIF